MLRVDRVTAASPEAIAAASRIGRRQASMGLYDDLAAHARDAARAWIKPRVDVPRARRALGLDADAKAPASAGS